jgi:hypothetical protein
MDSINSLNTILLGDFIAEVGKEDIFKPAIGNELLTASLNKS